MPKFLVTVNRNVKYSTLVGEEADTEEEAKEKALDSAMSWRFPADFDINLDSQFFVSYIEPTP